jgi:hypothetical protein
MRTPQQTINALAMLGLDCQCMVEIYMKFYTDVPRHERSDAQYGVCDGYQTFVTTNIIQEFSIIAYEALKLIEEQQGEIQELRQRYDTEFFIHLEKVRNSIHIYNKNGSYKEKAKRIIDSVNKQFSHNYNIPLFYRIKNNKAYLLATNINYYHMTDEFCGDKWLIGEKAKDFTEFISSIVSSLQPMAKNNIEQVRSPFSSSILNEISIESFDYTVESIMDKLKLDPSVCVRLLLMHSYVSFINLLFDEILHVDNCIDNPLWLCFFAKIYSIRYDEVLDSFDNLITFADNPTKELLQSLLDFNGFDRKESLREYARKLRNLVHYGLKEYPLIRKDDDKLADIERVYLDVVGLSTIEEFAEYFYALRFDMKLMESRFKRLFNMNYDTSIIARELAKGGKPI